MLLAEYHQACDDGFYHDNESSEALIKPSLQELRNRAKALNDIRKKEAGDAADPSTEDPKPQHENYTVERVQPANLEQGLQMFGYTTRGKIFDNRPCTVYIRVVYTD